jgi:hypothetical protein
MNKIINLFWYKHDTGKGNFGDELNYYIVKGLSGITPKHVDILKLPRNKIMAVKAILKKLYDRKINVNQVFNSEDWLTITGKDVIVGIGSVISWFDAPNITVWGSGLLNRNGHINEAKFLAVRGKYTLKRLNELGYNQDPVLGDPALLLPLIKKIPKIINKTRIGIIPHYIHYKFIKENLAKSDFLVINLLGSIEEIIKEINSCSVTFSSSLHGIIVSHAYNVQSLWVDFSSLENMNLSGDNIKFKDYFSSVGLKNYDPIKITNDLSFVDNIDALKNDYKDFLLPSQSIVKNIQNNLLAKAPFKIKEEFLN